LLWIAFGMRGIASLHRDLQGSSQDYLDAVVWVTIFSQTAASLFIFQRLLLYFIPPIPGDSCETDSRKQKWGKDIGTLFILTLS
jgi:hypothetical protein